jgi:hypothetical protein
MDDRSALIETIARGMIEQLGAAAAPIAREQAEDTALFDAELWRGIADVIESFRSEYQA